MFRFASVTLAAVMLVMPMTASAQGKDPLSFNRLLPDRATRNAPPTNDGIHDPTNSGTEVLQSPREAFAPLPDSNGGNFVDWVKALQDGLINPRYDLEDPDMSPTVMDLNIVREVKGSMPDVVFPHKEHTQWLDCANCHPAIFIPQRGANQLSMAAILMGEQCGACHGRVAFPVTECRTCHSRPKNTANEDAQ